MAELACITRNPFPPLEKTKAQSLQSPKDEYSVDGHFGSPSGREKPSNTDRKELANE